MHKMCSLQCVDRCTLTHAIGIDIHEFKFLLVAIAMHIYVHVYVYIHIYACMRIPINTEVLAAYSVTRPQR